MTDQLSQQPPFILADHLCRLPYFDLLAPDGCLHLAQHAIRREFSADQTLFLEGEHSAGLWILESGVVKVFKLNPDGREHIIQLFGTDDSFNEVSALDGGPNPANAASLSPMVAWIVPTEIIRQQIEANHELALHIIGTLGKRLRMLVDKVGGLALHPVASRLARFLLDQENNPAFEEPEVTRAVIASHLATTPESVSRTLRTLEEAGAIRFDRQEIVIVNATILEVIAGGE